MYTRMEKVQIRVCDYYGNPSYYSVMPRDIFDALETASLNGEETAMVNRVSFDAMCVNYEIKMENRK